LTGARAIEYKKRRSMARHLFIVSRLQPDLFAYLAREFASEADVTVLLDRRHAERRRHPHGGGPPADERRHGQRRAPSDVKTQLASLGYAFVRLD
jgi:hypothetical protein